MRCSMCRKAFRDGQPVIRIERAIVGKREFIGGPMEYAHLMCVVEGAKT